MVGAARHTVPPADTARSYLTDNAAFFVFISSHNRADRYAGRVAALHAGTGKEDGFVFRIVFAVGEAIDFEQASKRRSEGSHDPLRRG